jgi:hypothetical protein
LVLVWEYQHQHHNTNNTLCLCISWPKGQHDNPHTHISVDIKRGGSCALEMYFASDMGIGHWHWNRINRMVNSHTHVNSQ